MHTNTTFEFQRQQQVIVRQLLLQQNRFVIYGAAIFGLLLLITLGAVWLNPQFLPALQPAYVGIIFLGGYLFTSQIFHELNSRQQSYALLMLPASALEKLIAAWFLTGPGYLLFATLISYVIYSLGFLLADMPFSKLELLQDNYWESVGGYLIFQTIYLWGASYYRSHNFIKTLLALIALGVSCFFYLVLLEGVTNMVSDGPSRIAYYPDETMSTVASWLCYTVLGPYMLLVTFFTIKERQV